MKTIYNVEVQMKNKSFDSNNKLMAEALTFKDLDSKWITSNNSYELNLEDLNVSGLIKIDTEDIIDLQDKKVHRYPKITLPRQKLDLLKDRYNCKVVRDPSRADISIISLKYFDNILTKNWGNPITFLNAFNILKYLSEKNVLSEEALEKLRKFISSCDKDSMVNFQYHKDWHSSSNISDKTYDDFSSYVEEIKRKSSCNSYNWTLESGNVEAINNLISQKTQFVLDTQICNIIDEDLTVLDNTQYDEVKNMVISHDIDNRSLALEMLANCNIEKSFDVVSNIFYWQYEWLKSTNNWNSVNVKAFRNRLKDYAGGRNTTSIHSFNNYLNLLAKDRKLTEFAVNKTRKKLYSTLLNNFVGKESDVFKMDLDSLYINEELTSKTIING